MKKILCTILLLFGIIILCNNTYASENIEVINDDEMYFTDNMTNDERDINKDLDSSINNIEEPQKYSNYTYYIENYDVDIEVTENNIFNITEKIDVYFNTPSHGIYRNIPLSGLVMRNDGTSYKYKANISNIEINDKYIINKENNSKSVRIGNGYDKYTGKKQYIIKYSYSLLGDKTKDYDELYYNIIGTEWSSPIEKVTFKIAMPKEFDKEKIGFTYGKLDSVNTSGIEYEVDGNIIIGSFNKTLNSYNGLTVRIELDEGYFISPSLIDIFKANSRSISIIFFIILILISIIIWYLFGKDKQTVDTVEFYPPDDMNSLELAFAYKSKAEKSDITSLLIYLANKGYLKIVEEDGSYKFIKLKEYDGENEYEEIFFNGLFEEGDIVYPNDLKDQFYKTQNTILYKVNSKKNEEKIIKKTSKIGKILSKILVFVSIFILIWALVPIVNPNEESIVFMIFFGIGIGFLLAGIVNKDKNLKLIFMAFGIMWISISSMIAFMPVQGMQNIQFIENIDITHITILIIGLISFCVIWHFSSITNSRTNYGIKIKGKISGFKRFLENARKDELEALVEKHPTYFYDILPYTYVLGISAKWIKKFEEINYSSPEWNDGMEINEFNKFIDKTINSADYYMAFITSSSSDSYSSSDSSSSNSSSGGGSTGGGFAGRGTGGGGGGAW